MGAFRRDFVRGRRAGFRIAALASVLLAAAAAPASALVVSPFFPGHTTIDATTQVWEYRANVGFEYLPGQTQLDIDVPHGMVDDGGLIDNVTPGDWSFDYDVWAPLAMNHLALWLGGVVTYGNPAPGVFAVTWVNVANSDDPSIRNTFQVVFVGASGFQTNTGIPISPGSVVFAYGAPGDPSGTVHLSANTPAAVGISSNGLLTLAGLGVGDASGVLALSDTTTLQSSGDPFLFNREQGGFASPAAFDSIPNLLTASVAGRSGAGARLSVWPNPLGRGTTIGWTLALEGRVRLEVYDVSGRRVAMLMDETESAGPHELRWDGHGDAGSALAGGVYVVRLSGAGVDETRRVVYVP